MEKTANWFSKSDNMKIVLVAALSLVLVVVLMMRMSGDKDAEKPATPAETYNTAAETPAPFQKQTRDDNANRRVEPMKADTMKPPLFLKRDLFSYRMSKNSSKRDEGGSAPDLELNATITDDGEPLAIIGNEVFGTGEMVKGFRVTQIKNNEVILSKENRQYVIRISE